MGHLTGLEARLIRAGGQIVTQRRQRLADLSRALPRAEALLAPAIQRLDQWGERFPGSLRALITAKRGELRSTSAGLRATTIRFQIDKSRERVADRATRATRAVVARLENESRRLAALERLRQSMGYPATLKRGYAVIRDEAGHVLTEASQAAKARLLEIEFADTRLAALPQKTAKGGKPAPSPPDQGTLF